MEAGNSYPKHPWLETALSLLERRPELDTDAILAEEISRLSVRERSRVHEDVLGILKPPEETKEFVTERLYALEEALNQVPAGLRKAYDIALLKSPGYVKDPHFRLRFLRADRFDADLAAARMAKYFQFILDIFGEDALGRPLALKDLGIDGMADLKGGSCQLLQERDSADRSIFCYIQNYRQKYYHSGRSLAKVTFFMCCCAAEDIETSRKGAVFVMYMVFDMFKVDLEMESLVARASDAVPLYFSASHICISNPLLKRLMSPILNLYTTQDIQRTEVHSASSHIEMLHCLMCRGIPVDHIPLTESGNIKIRRHLKWIQGKRAQEISILNTGSFAGIDLPMSQDVLGGQGKGTYQHRGNILMKEMVEPIESQYFDADSRERKIMCLQVVEAVQKSGGRFLEQDKAGGFWEEVSTEKAMERVKICFKNVRFGRMRRKQAIQDIPGAPATKRTRVCDRCI